MMTWHREPPGCVVTSVLRMLRPDAHSFSTRAHLELAAQVVEAAFGPIVAKVAARLLSFGPLTLVELGRDTRLPPSQVRNALLLRMHS